MTVKVGEMAKLFTLKNQQGQDVDLKDFSGKKILLSFHPLAWTRVCAQQMESLEGKKMNSISLIPSLLGSVWIQFPARKPGQKA